MPNFIALSGQAGSGKSTAAQYLWQKHGFQRFAFADPLKALAGQALNLTPEQLEGSLKEVAEPRLGGRSPRWCLQFLGTEVFRSIWPEIWIWHLLESVRDCWEHQPDKPIVVTDVRFQDEAETLRGLGAMLVRLERPEAGARGGMAGHRSENDLAGWDGWDYVLDNNGSIGKLQMLLDLIVERG